MSNVEKALELARAFGSIDGGHHKMWLIDQMVRVLTNCPVIIITESYEGKEYTFETFGESEEYVNWIKEHNSGDDGPNTYNWDVGIAP